MIELKEGERLDDLQRNGFQIIQNPSKFCFGMDAVLLSGFAKVKEGERALDLGTGTGIIPILLRGKTKGRDFTGLEIQEESADMASAAEDGEPVYDPMPQSSLSQNEEPVDGVDSDYLVGQPPIGYQIYEVPDTMQTYDLDTAQADQLEALRGELYQNLAGRLLAALAKLPAEDAALLADNLSEEDYAAFLELAQP